MSSNIQNFYPVFAPNQVLTDTQLNHLRIYLDEQNRLTRSRMIGTGIICGLHAYHTDEEDKNNPGSRLHTLHITEGYGISSEGYLIEHGQNSYKHLRRFHGIDADKDGNVDYEAWNNTSKEIYELVPSKGNTPDYKDDGIEPLGEEYIKSRVLVLYLEHRSVDLKSCSVTDCANKGDQVKFILRLLLVHTDDLKAVFPKGRYSNNNNQKLQDLRIFVPRFHTEIADPDDSDLIAPKSKLQAIDETKGIRYVYGKIVKSIQEKLDKNLRIIIADNNSRGNFLNLPDIEKQLIRLQKLLNNDQDFSDFHQYHYGFASDLACAFNEFLQVYSKIPQGCKGPNDYPRHLMIRRFFEESIEPQGGIYRHRFQASLAQETSYETLRQTHALFMRIVEMIGNFRQTMMLNYNKMEELSRGVIITPSQDNTYCLGTQALPYYYKVFGPENSKARILDYWQTLTSCNSAPLHSYYFSDNQREHLAISEVQKRPLNYDIQKHSFYRIEGHLGKNCLKMKNRINALRKEHNLDFEVMILYTSPPPPPPEGKRNHPYVLFSDFVEKNWGLEYMGGVKPGGTFILICDPRCPGNEDNIIVADFALTGRVAEWEGSTYPNDSKDKDDPDDYDKFSLHKEDQSIKPVREQEVASSVEKITSPSKSLKKADGVANQGLYLRRQDRMKDMYDYNQGGAYNKSRTYSSSLEFISSAKIPANKLNGELKDVLGKLKSVYKRSNSPKQENYQGMILLVMQSYMDHLVELTPSALPTGAKETLQEEITDLKSQFGIKAGDLKKAWRASDIKKISNAPVIDQINKLIK